MNKALEKIRDEMALEHDRAYRDYYESDGIDVVEVYKEAFDAGAKAASEMYEERLKELYNLLGTTYQLAEMGVLLDCNSDHGKDVYEALRDTESFLYPEGQKHED